VSAVVGKLASAVVPTAWKTRVLSIVRRIPPGRVATYGDVAALAGRPRAARAVGNIMRGCRRPDVPCHRVIAANGRLGGYGGSELLKRSLLVAEGVPIAGSRVRDLERVRWQARPPQRSTRRK
jgi:O-6-methylguanine DNA methyltransferase